MPYVLFLFVHHSECLSTQTSTATPVRELGSIVCRKFINNSISLDKWEIKDKESTGKKDSRRSDGH
jgi:hypothetical protein